MLLIADSGSTKANWRLVHGPGESENFLTSGINPHYTSTVEIESYLDTELLPSMGKKANLVTEVYFYGAGCSSPEDNRVVQTALNTCFPHSRNIVEHDLLASARAVFGNEEGIACILGTGSNSCHYDGELILDNVPSLGFILGDEGSGADLGRNLVKSFFYREMPEDLAAKFREKYHLSKDDLLQKVFHSPTPSRFMAGFATFYSENLEHPLIQELLNLSFGTFIKRMVLKYPDSRRLPVGFVGSVAAVFQDVIKQILSAEGLRPGPFIRNPMDRLVEYHLQSQEG